MKRTGAEAEGVRGGGTATGADFSMDLVTCCFGTVVVTGAAGSAGGDAVEVASRLFDPKSRERELAAVVVWTTRESKFHVPLPDVLGFC